MTATPSMGSLEDLLSPWRIDGNPSTLFEILDTQNFGKIGIQLFCGCDTPVIKLIREHCTLAQFYIGNACIGCPDLHLSSRALSEVTGPIERIQFMKSNIDVIKLALERMKQFNMLSEAYVQEALVQLNRFYDIEKQYENDVRKAHYELENDEDYNALFDIRKSALMRERSSAIDKVGNELIASGMLAQIIADIKPMVDMLAQHIALVEKIKPIRGPNDWVPLDSDDTFHFLPDTLMKLLKEVRALYPNNLPA